MVIISVKFVPDLKEAGPGMGPTQFVSVLSDNTQAGFRSEGRLRMGEAIEFAQRLDSKGIITLRIAGDMHPLPGERA